jgi:hypothetical protein
LPVVKLPALPTTGSATTAAAASTALWPRAVDLKVLLVAGNGSEPSFEAMKFFFNHMGIPYTAVIAQSQALPALTNGTTGLYNAIILATGSLAICDAAGCRSALPDADWLRLDAYARDYRVRVVSCYTWPEARYGLVAVGAQSTDSTALMAKVASGGTSLFNYLNSAAQVKISMAYTYTATTTAAAGETTTPVLQTGTLTLGALHKKADGREYLALTFDQNPYLQHSMLLNYGLINWATKGHFLGQRKIYFSPQNDDLFLASDLFVAGIEQCRPFGYVTDPTFDPSPYCPDLRLTAGDLDTLTSWQKTWRGNSLFSGFRIAHAFNGYGTTQESGFGGPQDALTARVKALAGDYYWVSHTYTHESLDCYDPVPYSGSATCVPASFAQSQWEISQNKTLASSLKLNLDSASMVTPGISGLANAEFLSAAYAAGVRYLVSDTSRPEHQPAFPNTGVVSSVNPGIYLIPRRATNIFYNAFSGLSNANGSEPDEYNFFYGPNGVFRTASGAPWFNTVQTHAQIVDRESDNLLTYMLRYEMYPAMFHQANFARYSGSNSLFTDVVDATFNKYRSLMNLPVASLQQTDIGKMLQERAQYLGAGVTARYTPFLGITLRAQKAAMAPLTGACGQNCATYGGQKQSRTSIAAGGSVFIPLFY